MKQLFVFDLDKPADFVWKLTLRYIGVFLAVAFAVVALLGGLVNLGWVEPNSWLVLVLLSPVFIVALIGGLLLAAPVVVGLFIASRLPVPKPLAERNMLFASGGWVVRAFVGALLLAAGGIIGGFIAQSLDFVAELAAVNPPPGEGDTHLSPGAAAVLKAFVDLVFLWLGFAVVIALIAAAIAIIVMSVRLLRGGYPARLQALTPRAEPPALPSARRYAWRRHFAHWGYSAYLLGYLYLFGGVVAALIVIPLSLARQGLLDWIQSFIA